MDFFSYYIEIPVMIAMFTVWRVLSNWQRRDVGNSSRTPLVTPLSTRASHTYGFWSGDIVDLETVDLTRDEYVEDEEDRREDEQRDLRKKGVLWNLYDWLV